MSGYLPDPFKRLRKRIRTDQRTKQRPRSDVRNHVERQHARRRALTVGEAERARIVALYPPHGIPWRKGNR